LGPAATLGPAPVAIKGIVEVIDREVGCCQKGGLKPSAAERRRFAVQQEPLGPAGDQRPQVSLGFQHTQGLAQELSRVRVVMRHVAVGLDA
jgi:hypothetical protein